MQPKIDPALLKEDVIRLEHLKTLKAAGVNPYPSGAERTHTLAEARAVPEGSAVKIAGRLIAIRDIGKLTFANLKDESGELQIALSDVELGQERYKFFVKNFDVGDFIAVVGEMFVAKKGEVTVRVKEYSILAKALLPLPEKWHGLKDVESRERQRELDLLSNPEIRQRFVIRSRLISSLRRFLDTQDFLEVETPILHPIPGGANARPFITHHNALNIDLYLRIAPELYLKRLLVGGFEKIYEIGRCFRNEGIDYSHNPEFTMLELYWTYAGKERFLNFLEQMFTTMVQETLGTLKIMHKLGEVNFVTPWPRVTFRQAVLDASGIDIDAVQTPKDVLAAAKKARLEIDFSKCVGLGEYYDELYKKTARPKIAGPIWVMDYPASMIPLANYSPDDASKSATAQLIVHGVEVIKAFYHELNDPIEQRKRLEDEEALAKQGSEEAQRLDEAFLSALEHGMPPASGMGMGIDRLASLLTGAPNLKEIIFFPTLRPEHKD